MTKKPVKANKNIIARTDPKPAPKLAQCKEAKSSALSTTKGILRENSKQAHLIEMLRQPAGVTIQQLMDVTGWQQHSVRGFISGTVKRKLGLAVTVSKDKAGTRTYRAKAA